MHEERGALLFRAANASPWRSIAVALGWIAVSLLWAVDSARHGWDAMDVTVGVIYAGICIVYAVRSVRGVVFYEKGIYFPDEPSGARARFIPWNAVERFHWDGDILTLVPQTSILATGGATPLAGGSVKAPPERRVEIERLLTAIRVA